MDSFHIVMLVLSASVIAFYLSHKEESMKVYKPEDIPLCSEGTAILDKKKMKAHYPDEYDKLPNVVKYSGLVPKICKPDEES